MAHTDVISTVGAANSDSYISIVDADEYNERLVYGGTWVGSQTAKATALIQSTKLLDEWVDWFGEAVDDVQALLWPRYSVLDRKGYDILSDVIPIELQRATAELARLLLAADLTKSPDTQGFSELKADVLLIKIDKDDRDRIGVLPESVVIMISPYGKVRKRGNAGTVELVRA